MNPADKDQIYRRLSLCQQDSNRRSHDIILIYPLNQCKYITYIMVIINELFKKEEVLIIYFMKKFGEKNEISFFF